MPITATTEDTTGAISGLEGNLSLGGAEMASLRNWKVSEKCEVKKYSTNQTGGRKKTLKGPIEGSGSADVYIEQGTVPALEIGKLYAFSGTMKTGGTPYAGVVRISGLDIEVDIESGEPISGTLSFETHGALAQTAG